MNADRFMDLYKELEERLKQLYEGKRLHNSSIVMHFMSTPEGKPFKDVLNTCREMRNILAHHTDIKGEAPFLPAQGTLDALREIIDYVSAPPLALDFATPGAQVICAHLADNARATMRRMLALGFSHIPVLDKGRLFGIFSVSTVFSYTLHTGQTIAADTTITAFSPYLPVKNHATETFLFVKPTATLWEIREKLSKPQSSRKKRLAAVFITKNGSQDAPLLGMVTPWDVLGKLEDTE